jgi:hypothetical protein
MTRFRIFAALTFLVASLYGCDCVQIARARVLDATTKQPIDSVKVYKKSRAEQNTLTNHKGEFELHSISGGLSGCPPMTVVLTKAGYRTKTVDVGSDSSTVIYLDKGKFE